VCGGVLLLPREQALKGRFKLPYFNGRWVVPFITILIFAGCIYYKPPAQVEMGQGKRLKERVTIFESLKPAEKTVLYNEAVSLYGARAEKNASVDNYIKGLEDDKFNDVVRASSIPESQKYNTGFIGHPI